MSPLSDTLKKAIQQSGETHYSLARKAGIRPQMIDYFMRGERSLRLETADKLAGVLRLKLTSSSDR